VRRTRFDIIIDILKVSLEGANKTKIVYGANLNFKLAQEYIDFMIEAKLLEQEDHKNSKVYNATEKGIELLTKFKELTEAVNL